MERNSEFVEKISTNELEQINQLVSFVFVEQLGQRKMNAALQIMK